MDFFRYYKKYKRFVSKNDYDICLSFANTDGT